VNLNLYSGIGVCWIALIAVWLVGIAFSKRSVRKQSSGGRTVEIALGLLGALIVSGRLPLGSWGAARFVPHTHSVALIGFVLTLAGCLFAVWARITLGTNWSGRPSVKAGHELIVKDPYALARHPIYTGILLALVGTFLAGGQWRCIVGFPFILLALGLKMRYEEQLMMQTFPEDYPNYRRRVKALIPGVL
jgi:protein-S-isoprenylcysteine O-methyltransferase Ste14